MSVENNDIKEMTKTCQIILDRCDKPFVWEDEDVYEKGDYKKPFNLFFLHPQIDKELSTLFETFTGKNNIYEQIQAACTLEAEWAESGTYGLDRDFTCTFSRFLLKPQYVEQVKSHFTNRLNELEQMLIHSN